MKRIKPTLAGSIRAHRCNPWCILLIDSGQVGDLPYLDYMSKLVVKMNERGSITRKVCAMPLG